ncbi:hypothetical protein Dimus_035087 [Dionaea muscipula]
MGKSFQKERIGPYEIFVKEFYAKMSVIHLKKKDIVKSKVRGVEIEFDHEKLATILRIPGNNGICEYVKDVWKDSKYIKPLEITRRGNRGSDDRFYDAQVEVEEPSDETQATQRSQLHLRLSEKDKEPSGVDPSCPTGKIPEAEFLKFQAEFERKRANRFHDDLEKAKAENARLLALLHQAQTKPHP